MLDIVDLDGHNIGSEVGGGAVIFMPHIDGPRPATGIYCGPDDKVCIAGDPVRGIKPESTHRELPTHSDALLKSSFLQLPLIITPMAASRQYLKGCRGTPMVTVAGIWESCQSTSALQVMGL